MNEFRNPRQATLLVYMTYMARPNPSLLGLATVTELVPRRQSVIHVGWTGHCIHPYWACPTLAERESRRLSLNQAEGQDDVLYATFLLFPDAEA